MKIFKEKSYKNSLCELSQSLEMRMAFVTKTRVGHYVNSHDLVRCRDFLGDIVFAKKHQTKASIYGFRFNPFTQKTYKTKTMLVVNFPHQEALDNFKSNFPIIMEDLQKESGISGGSYEETQNDLQLIVTAPSFWQNSIAAISYYTFLLKCCGYALKDPTKLLESVAETTTKLCDWDGTEIQYPSTEASFLKKNHVIRTLPIFVKNIKKLVANVKYEYTTFNNIIHNNHGFVTICSTFQTQVGVRLKELVGECDDTV